MIRANRLVLHTYVRMYDMYVLCCGLVDFLMDVQALKQPNGH